MRESPHLCRVETDDRETRSFQSEPCSRYYGSEDFDVFAACLHAVTERWEFRFAVTDVDHQLFRPMQEVLHVVVSR